MDWAGSGVLHCCIEREVLRQEALQDSATEHVVEL
jgi:hypothetical protein